MDHSIIQLGIYDTGIDAKPGYGDSAQTGMFVPFFEKVAPELPVSMLAEIRSGSLSEGGGALMRDIMLRDVLEQAVADGDATPLRRRVREIWRSTLDLWFLVEPQPDPSHTLAIDRIEPSGQAIPKVAIEYPAYFADCVERLTGWLQRHVPRGRVKHLGSIPTAFHWLGTTRMSTSPADGCVDSTLRYHDLENLYVLSTSVFPSASSANPTLTLAALALRLGDHLAPAGSGKTLMALEYPPRTTGPGCYTEGTNVD